MNPLPVATVSAMTICKGTTADLTATLGTGSTPSMTYTWNINGTSSTTSANNMTSQVLNAMTTYTVQLTNSNGCTGVVSGPATITVREVDAVPGCTITPSTLPSLFCGYYVRVSFTATATAGSSDITGYQWKRNGVAIADATSATYSDIINASGSYTVAVSADNDCSTTSAAVAVRVSGGEGGRIGSTTASCEGEVLPGKIGVTASTCPNPTGTTPGLIGSLAPTPAP
jgi:hypothetical protein